MGNFSIISHTWRCWMLCSSFSWLRRMKKSCTEGEDPFVSSRIDLETVDMPSEKGNFSATRNSLSCFGWLQVDSEISSARPVPTCTIQTSSWQTHRPGDTFLKKPSFTPLLDGLREVHTWIYVLHGEYQSRHSFPLKKRQEWFGQPLTPLIRLRHRTSLRSNGIAIDGRWI